MTKIITIIGTLLVGLPILAPFVFSAASLVSGQGFRFDFLIPAELFQFSFFGDLLLLLAARRARTGQKLIGIGLIIAVGSFAGGQILAMAAGLDSDQTVRNGWVFGLVWTTLFVYVLAQVVICAGGISLIRDLFKKGK